MLTDTLDAYIDKYESLVPFIADNASGSATSDPAPVDQTSKAISLQVRPLIRLTVSLAKIMLRSLITLPYTFLSHPRHLLSWILHLWERSSVTSSLMWKQQHTMLETPSPPNSLALTPGYVILSYRRYIFTHAIPGWSTCLKNNLRLESTFLTIDQLVSGQWTTVRSDSHPSTTYQWIRTNAVCLFPFSAAYCSNCLTSVSAFGYKHCEHFLVRG